MKTLIINLLFALCPMLAFAQGCLPEGIIFSSQDQIDNFQENYPGCTVIEGDVVIVDLGDPIDNLEGLSVLTSIGADLWIAEISLPNGLNGLNNLVSIGGDLTIEWTDSLGSLQGLESLTSIGDSLTINWTYNLYNLSGLDNLSSIGGALTIQYCFDLASLSDLENLASIGGDVTIAGNDALSECAVQGICNYLSNPTAAVNIYDNANGCNNPPEVASGCGITLECLPYGNYYFLNQEEIDDFQDDYSDCTELEGNVTIGNEVNNLMGLNSVTLISGNLDFWGNNVLTSLSGLDNLNYVGGSLSLLNLDTLTNLTGLLSLDSCGGNIIIACRQLPSLTGLNALSSVGGNLYLGYYNWGGPGYLGNPALTSLTGLEGLTSIEGNLNIYGNSSLTTLSGLENLNSIGGSISIIYNWNLTDCAIQGLCDYLTNPNGTVDIYGNSSGCNSQSEVAGNCGGTSYCLTFGNYYFLSQADIDNFPVTFSGCTDLKGIVAISGLDIINLSGLNQVESIEGALQIGIYNIFSGTGNPLLEDLSGLENLAQIGGDLWINQNDSLISLAGLDNLTTIGGSLLIGFDYVGPDRSGMSSLSSLAALNNLTSIGGILCVRGTAVTNLTGLDNIDAGSISYLDIEQNSFLSTCDVNSICSYLATPDADFWISGNAPGCNSQEEVEAACSVGVEESAVACQQSAVSCYPNPTSGIVDLQFTIYSLQSVLIKIYDVQGREVAVVLDQEMAAGEQTVDWDASGLPSGVYFYRLAVGGQQSAVNGKVVKY